MAGHRGRLPPSAPRACAAKFVRYDPCACQGMLVVCMAAEAGTVSAAQFSTRFRGGACRRNQRVPSCPRVEHLFWEYTLISSGSGRREDSNVTYPSHVRPPKSSLPPLALSVPVQTRRRHCVRVRQSSAHLERDTNRSSSPGERLGWLLSTMLRRRVSTGTNPADEDGYTPWLRNAKTPS